MVTKCVVGKTFISYFGKFTNKSRNEQKYLFYEIERDKISPKVKKFGIREPKQMLLLNLAKYKT